MKCRWLVLSLAALAGSASADFCTRENGKAWQLVSGDLARRAEVCRRGVVEDDDIETCRPLIAKVEQTRTISLYAQECYERERTGRAGFGYSSQRSREVENNMKDVAAALETMRKFQAGQL
jgi:hypothetical protein